LAQRVESTGTEGDRILTVCSRVLLTVSSLLKNEGKKKRNSEVIGGEGDENDDVKTNKK